MDLKRLFLIAKDSRDYTCFCMELGQIIGIPPTDARCNDIQIVDLLDKNFIPNESKTVNRNENAEKFCEADKIDFANKMMQYMCSKCHLKR